MFALKIVLAKNNVSRGKLKTPAKKKKHLREINYLFLDNAVSMKLYMD